MLLLHTGAPDDVTSGLQRLMQLEILDIEDDPRSPERGQYTFVQSLIREVAYRRLGRQDRRAKAPQGTEVDLHCWTGFSPVEGPVVEVCHDRRVVSRSAGQAKLAFVVRERPCCRNDNACSGVYCGIQ